MSAELTNWPWTGRDDHADGPAALRRALSDLLEYAGSRDPVDVINFNTHFDLRGDQRATSGTSFRQILERGRAQGREVSYHCLGISRYSNTAALGVDAALIDRLIGTVIASGRISIAAGVHPLMAPRLSPGGAWRSLHRE